MLPQLLGLVGLQALDELMQIAVVVRGSHIPKGTPAMVSDLHVAPGSPEGGMSLSERGLAAKYGKTSRRGARSRMAGAQRAPASAMAEP